MEYTEILQSCTSLMVEDIFKYRIGLSVADKGDLPHTHIFVYTIVAGDNPASDVFARLANVSDLQVLLRDRDEAVDQGKTEYLSPTAEFYYEELDVAVSAKAAVTSRVNELVNDWVTYYNQFIDTDGKILYYPTSDPGVEDALRSAYTEARAERVYAETQVADADRSVQLAKKTLVYEQKLYDVYKSSCTILTRIYQPPTYGELYTYKGFILDEGSIAQTYFGGTLVPSMEELKAQLCSNVPAQAGVVAAATSAYETSLEAKKEAEASLSAAQAKEDAALAAILRLCPTFTPP